MAVGKAGHANEVRLVGRLSGAPQERELPSGDTVVIARLVVSRPDAEGAARRQRVDVLDCAGWTPRVQRAMRGWRDGDLAEVRGALRRRFYKNAGRSASRVEIEVSSVRMVRRAAA